MIIAGYCLTVLIGAIPYILLSNNLDRFMQCIKYATIVDILVQLSVSGVRFFKATTVWQQV